MLAAVGAPHCVCPAGIPLIVAALELYCPKEYQRTLPTVTLGAVKDHPAGAVAPVVFEGVAGAADVWLCDLYAVSALSPESPVAPVAPELPVGPLGPVGPVGAIGAHTNAVLAGLSID